jgi:AcrR family transcriptional regulator
VDRSLLRAALQLLAEEGYAALTMEAIAARAGVGKATLYRRWKSPQDVVTAAVADMVEEILVPDTGSLEEDLLALMTQAVAAYRGAMGRLLPGLLAAMAAYDGVAHAVRTRFLEGRRAALTAVLERGVARGELPPHIDVPLALDFLGGPLFYRLLVTDGDLDDDFAAGVVTTLLHGVAETAHRNNGTEP